MNPDKKRKTDDDEDDLQQRLYKAAADRGYKTIMATDCSDNHKIRKVLKTMEPLAQGLLHQRFVEEDTQFNRDKEEFEAKMRENEKVKKVLEALEVVSPPPQATVSSSSSSSSGGGGGVMGSLFGRK